MTIDNFCFYLQNRLIKTSQTGGQLYSDTSPLVFPDLTLSATYEWIQYASVCPWQVFSTTANVYKTFLPVIYEYS
jgi:hypothetical protein